MHTFFLLSALLLAALISLVGTLVLRLLPVGRRRPAAIVVLVLPPAVLLIATTHLIPRFWPECAPLVGWDEAASFGLLGLVGGVALVGIGLGLVRLVLVERLLPRCDAVDDAAIGGEPGALAARLGLKEPHIGVLHLSTPLAVAGGLKQPTVLLSSWLLENLDEDERASVVAHELVHLARRDYVVRWVARLLRDATAYLPGAWYALRVLEEEEELAADARAVETTGRPMAMASALAKVWRAVSTSEPSRLAGMPAYADGSAALLEERLTRLVSGQALPRSNFIGRVAAGASLLITAEIATTLLALSAATIPNVCNMRM